MPGARGRMVVLHQDRISLYRPLAPVVAGEGGGTPRGSPGGFPAPAGFPDGAVGPAVAAPGGVQRQGPGWTLEGLCTMYLVMGSLGTTDPLRWELSGDSSGGVGVVSRDCLPPEPRCQLPSITASAAGSAEAPPPCGGGASRWCCLSAAGSRRQTLSPPCRGPYNSGSQGQSSFASFVRLYTYRNIIKINIYMYWNAISNPIGGLFVYQHG